MKFNVHLKGHCTLVHVHSSKVEIEAPTEEEARQKALDLLDQKKIVWGEDQVVGKNDDIVLDSVDCEDCPNNK